MDNTQNYNKSLGSFRGLAIGDSLGAPVEFMPKGTFRKITDYKKPWRFGLNAGEWTDDTIMALCLAESLIEDNGYNSYTAMEKYVDWFKNGYNSPNGKCFDIGIQTKKCLNNYLKEPTLNPVTKSAGNGTIMRLAPAVIVSLNLNEADSKTLFAETAIDTHNSVESILSTQLFGLILRNLLHGQDKEEALNNADASVDHPFVDDLVLEMYLTGADSLGTGGRVIETLCTTWWCFAESESFEEAVLKAANLGGDADTLAAVTGQLAGAYYGDSSIPDQFKDKLYRSKDFETLTSDLLKVDQGVLRTRTEQKAI